MERAGTSLEARASGNKSSLQYELLRCRERHARGHKEMAMFIL